MPSIAESTDPRGNARWGGGGWEQFVAGRIPVAVRTTMNEHPRNNLGV